jgi:hypothetical protein
MRGTLAEGDCLWVSPAPFDSLQAGDVVAFRSGGQVLAHRIVGRHGEAIKTQGDGNWRRDASPLLREALIGKVMERERDGIRSAVAGGARGRRRGRFFHAISFLRWTVLRLLAPGYRLVRASRIASLVWKPRIQMVFFATAAGRIAKFIHRGRTVACWMPQEEQWTCRKPYDLLLSPPDR